MRALSDTLQHALKFIQFERADLCGIKSAAQVSQTVIWESFYVRPLSDTLQHALKFISSERVSMCVPVCVVVCVSVRARMFVCVFADEW